MSFYGLMQLGVPQLKGLLRQAAGAERRRLLLALLARDAACVGFAVVFISALTALFGGANSPAAVVIFCLLLSCRFVHYNYRMADTLRNMAAAFALLTLGPALAPLGGPPAPPASQPVLYRSAAAHHRRPARAGQRLPLPVQLSFPVWKSGQRALASPCGGWRCCWASPCAPRCSTITTGAGHRSAPSGRYSAPFPSPMKVPLAAPGGRGHQPGGAHWGAAGPAPHHVGVGFSCSSILTAYGSHPVRRAAGRVGGVLGGSPLFCLLYQLCPPALHGGLGILSGLCLGLCASYGFCTVFNCLGALLTASALFGPGPAAAIRVCNNVLGSLFGLFFALVWPWLLDALSRRRTAAARES